jgi:hypothetical protein
MLVEFFSFGDFSLAAAPALSLTAAMAACDFLDPFFAIFRG